MSKKLGFIGLSLIISLSVFTNANAVSVKYSDYFVAGEVGGVWEYVDLNDSAFIWTLEKITDGPYSGKMKFGTVNSGYVYDFTGGIVTWYEVSGVKLDPPFPFPEFIETGIEINIPQDDNSVAIYLIQNSISVQGEKYNDVLAEVFLDKNFPPNPMNTTLHLDGITSYAVTDVAWFARGFSLVKYSGVDAKTGNDNGNDYELVSYISPPCYSEDCSGGDMGNDWLVCFIDTAVR